MEKFYTRQDVAAMTGWSLPTVTQVFARPDFPALIIGKRQIVNAEAFRNWISKRHTNKDFN